MSNVLGVWLLIMVAGHGAPTTVEMQSKEACFKAAAQYNSHFHGGQKAFYHADCVYTGDKK